MTEIQDDSWKDETFRKNTIEEINLVIKATGLKVTAEKLEAAIFTKSNSKEKYLENVSKVCLQLKQRANERLKEHQDDHDKSSGENEKQDEMEKDNKHIEESSSEVCDKNENTTTESTTTESIDKLGNETHKDSVEMEVTAEKIEEPANNETREVASDLDIAKDKITEPSISHEELQKNSTDSSQKINEPQKDASEMEGALKRLSIAESVKVKTEVTEAATVSIKSLDQNQPKVLPSPPPAKPPVITPVNIAELRIAQVQGNVRLPEVAPVIPNRPSEIRITQVQSFHSNAMQRPHLIIQRRTSDPPPTHAGNVRSSVPRIANVTSLHRPPMREGSQPMQNHPGHMQHRIPLPTPTRPTLFEESKRFKYREGLIRRMLMAEESVYHRARNEEQYVTFFQNLFNETTNQINLNTDPHFKIASCTKCKVHDTPHNLYKLLTNEPDHIKIAITEEYKSIDYQIKSILKTLTVDPDDISIRDVKLPPDEFERNISLFCTKMSTNYSISEKNDVIKID